MNFSGTIKSDYMKLAQVPERKKPSLIDFAATDFLTLKESLIKYIKAVYPLEYTYFVESDLGMMLLELVAYMGAVSSMKADMLANENFFATAKQRSSVKKLLKLIGVRMRGPLSAAADARLTLATSPIAAAPAHVPSVKLQPSNRVFSVLSPEDEAQVSYTLYKVVNGLVDEANSTGDLIIYNTETDNPLDGSTIYSNLALQEGALVTDAGEFAATEGLKTIKLTQSPVVEGSVQVYITSTSNTSGAYTEVDNIYFASGSSDRIFELVYDDTYAATIVFGDGAVGSLPEDSASYFITYRVGGGTRGNVSPNSLNVIINGATNPPGYGAAITGNLTNTSVATGGSNAETIEQAKRWAPLTFARQDRIVTLNDYTVFANTFISTWGTVGKAQAATRKAYSSANIIDIYVLEKASNIQLQKATTNFKTQLLAAINEKKMITDEVVVADGLIRTLDLVTTISIDKEEERNQAQIIAKVRNKILKYMNADNRNFGESLSLSEVNRQIFEIEEVRISSIDNISQDILIAFNEIIQLNNLTINVELLD